MSSRETDLRAVERLLRETTPPAAVTVDFRQRVVQASLDARLGQLSRQRVRRSMLFGLVSAFILIMPFGLLIATLMASPQAGTTSMSEFRTAPLGDAGLSAGDGNDILAIQQQLERRAQNWLAVQRSSKQ